MAPLTLGTVHHIRLTVTDLERSRAFYTEVLGFQVAMDTLPSEDDEFYGLLEESLQRAERSSKRPWRSSRSGVFRTVASPSSFPSVSPGCPSRIRTGSSWRSARRSERRHGHRDGLPHKWVHLRN